MSFPDRDNWVAVIHDLFARELPQLVGEHAGHQGVSYAVMEERLCAHRERFVRVEGEA